MSDHYLVEAKVLVEGCDTRESKEVQNRRLVKVSGLGRKL